MVILLTTFAIAGVLLGVLVGGRVPTPVLHPDAGENDGSMTVAYVVSVVPMSGWLLWKLGGRRALTTAVAIAILGFTVAFLISGNQGL